MNEDKTSLNELEDLEDNQPSHEDDSTGEGEGASESESGEPDTITLTKDEFEAKLAERAKEQDRRWKDRLKVAKEDDKEERQESSQEGSEKGDRVDRLELKTEGVTSKSEQDAVIEYAKWKGIDVVTALNTPAMQAELKTMRDKASTPAPSSRPPRKNTDDIDYWVKQFVDKGKSAPDVETRRKVRQRLAQK